MLVPWLLLCCAVPMQHEVGRQRHFRESFEVAETNSSGYVEYVHRLTGMRFVLLGPGVLMGGVRCGPPLFCHGHEWQPPVALGAFLLAKNEVDVATWNGNVGPDEQLRGNGAVLASNMTWYECERFCRRLGLSLPTEIQWEYAYWCGQSRLPEKHPSDEFRPWVSGQPVPRESRCGLIGMEDGVWEWCEDEWPCFAGVARVVRGHYWIYRYLYCATSSSVYLSPYGRLRAAVDPLNADRTIGCRPAASVPAIELLAVLAGRGRSDSRAE